MLSPSQIDAYHEQGFLVISQLFTESELQRVSAGLNRAVDKVCNGDPRPQTRYTIQGNVVEDPDLASIANHPQIVEAVETLLGGPSAMSTFVGYLKTPGAPGTRGDYEGSHPTAHQDYKTYHAAGSSLNWLFAITSLVDLDEETGPLFVSPGSHKHSRILKASGRVRHVQRAHANDIAPLVDTKLRRGDLLLMNMFTWHEGGANRSDHNRFGIYNKYRALNAPPAAGPVQFSNAAHRAVTYKGRSLLPHYGDDPIRAARLIVEHNERFLMMVDNGEKWTLPGRVADPSPTKINLIDLLDKAADEELNIDVPWMSHIDDYDEPSQTCRVYGYSVPTNDQVFTNATAKWFTIDQVNQLAEQDQLLHGYERQAIELWMDPSCLRGIGQSKLRAPVRR